jgi:hypothetical protein
MTLPSSPADASSSPGREESQITAGIFAITDVECALPFGAHRTTLTACVCLASVERYSTFRSSPSPSTFQSYVFVSMLLLRWVSIVHLLSHYCHHQPLPVDPSRAARSGPSRRERSGRASGSPMACSSSRTWYFRTDGEMHVVVERVSPQANEEIDKLSSTSCACRGWLSTLGSAAREMMDSVACVFEVGLRWLKEKEGFAATNEGVSGGKELPAEFGTKDAPGSKHDRRWNGRQGSCQAEQWFANDCRGMVRR